MQCNSLIIAILLAVILDVSGQSNCNRVFRGVRRVGANLAGRLEFPVDETYPRFQLRLKFNRAIQQLTIRQFRARYIGASRREFLVDPAELKQNDGVLRITALLRLRNVFSPSPKLIGAVYNGKLLCGENIFEDAVVVDLQTSTKRSAIIQQITSTSKSPKDQEEEEVF